MFKRLILALAFLPAVSWASFQPVNGSTITVVSPNNNTTPIPIIAPAAIPIVSTNTLVVSGPIAVTPGATNLVVVSTSAIPTGTNSIGQVTVNPGATNIVITSTATIPISAASLPTHAVTQSGAWTVSPAATNLVVTSTSAIPTGANVIGSVVATPGATNLVVTATTTLLMQGAAATGAAPSGNPIYNGGIVSSTTFPTQQLDGKIAPVLVDQVGRVVTVGGAPGGVWTSSSSINGAAYPTEVILVSSPAANSYVYLCGMICDNTSATNVSFDIYQTTSPYFTANNGAKFSVGCPANMVNGGLWPGCANPFFKSKAGGQITIKPSTTATSVPFYTQYYTGP